MTLEEATPPADEPEAPAEPDGEKGDDEEPAEEDGEE